MRSNRLSAIAVAALISLTASANADPYRLRGDALLATQPDVGLLVLQAQDQVHPWLNAEAMIWAGAGEDNSADALVIFVRARDPQNRGELQVGRMVLATGAIRPIHVDGALALGNTPWGTRVEVFGGAPVVPRFGERTADWLVGGRVSHKLDRIVTAGVSFLYRRDRGLRSDQEIGVDATSQPKKWLSIGARAAYDILNPGIADSRLIVAAFRKSLRVEVFGGRRSPARILPATSLFAALGDFPSDELGASGRWRAAPRLDVSATAIARTVGDDTGADLSCRALLRLDDFGKGSVAIDVRRAQIPDAQWTGVRITSRVPVRDRLSLSTELELVIPDEANGRGRVWPWALTAMRYAIDKRWTAAFAVEASSSPQFVSEINALFRLSSRWESLR